MDKGSATMTGCDVEASSAVQTTAAAPATTAPATTAAATTAATATAGWMEKFSAKHQKPYWKNRVSGEVTWKNPLAGKGVVTAAAAPATRKKSTTTTAKKKRKSQTDDHSSSSTYSLPAVPSRITGHQVDGWQTPMDTPDQFVTGIDTPTVVPATAAVAVECGCG